MAGTALNFTSGISDLGGAVSSLFTGFGQQASAEGDRAAAAGYRTAAGYAGENVGLATTSLGIQETAASRSIYQNLSTQRSTAASNGFRESGSALDILTDSANQGELQRQLISANGEVTIQSYQAEQAKDLAMAQQEEDAANAADTGAIGSFLGGALKGIGAVAQFAPFLAL